MTPEQLDDIEARNKTAREASVEDWQDNNRVIEALTTSMYDVPALVAEVRQLQNVISMAEAGGMHILEERNRLRATVNQAYALLDHWHDLGRSDGMHGRELRQVLDSALDVDKEQTA